MLGAGALGRPRGMVWGGGVERDSRKLGKMPMAQYHSLIYLHLKSGALGRPRGMVCGGRREEGSGWGTHVYLWRIHFDIWQN